MKALHGRLTSTLCVPLGLLVMLCTARSVFAQEAAKRAADYWPFREGNTWTLDTTFADKKVAQVITVTRVVAKDGKTRAELEYKIEGHSTQKETYEVDANSIVRIASGPNGINVLNPPLPVVQFPLTVGKKWDWKGEVTTGNASFKATSQLSVADPETVKTDAGSFRAVRVHMDLELVAGEKSLKVVNDYWFAPHIGLVRQKATIGPQSIEGVITSYKLVQ